MGCNLVATRNGGFERRSDCAHTLEGHETKLGVFLVVPLGLQAHGLPIVLSGYVDRSDIRIILIFINICVPDLLGRTCSSADGTPHVAMAAFAVGGVFHVGKPIGRPSTEEVEVVTREVVVLNLVSQVDVQTQARILAGPEHGLQFALLHDAPLVEVADGGGDTQNRNLSIKGCIGSRIEMRPHGLVGIHGGQRLVCAIALAHVVVAAREGLIHVVSFVVTILNGNKGPREAITGSGISTLSFYCPGSGISVHDDLKHLAFIGTRVVGIGVARHVAGQAIGHLAVLERGHAGIELPRGFHPSEDAPRVGREQTGLHTPATTIDNEAARAHVVEQHLLSIVQLGIVIALKHINVCSVLGMDANRCTEPNDCEGCAKNLLDIHVFLFSFRFLSVLLTIPRPRVCLASS